MTAEQIDAIARAGFEAHATYQNWDTLSLPERARWRMAVEFTTARSIRDGYFEGFYGVPEWEDLPEKSRRKWKDVSAAMHATRIRAGVTVTDITPRHPLIRTAETIAS